MEDISHTKQQYIVKTTHFEGPLEVLLTMIEKRKLLINQVSLAMVTEEFMQYIESMHDPVFIREKTHFVSIASILLLIKAKSLLPTMPTTEEESEDIVDLEKRLRILNFVRGVSKKIEQIYGTRVIYPEGNFKKDIVIFAPSRDVEKTCIQEAIHRVIQKLPKPEKKLPEVAVKKTVSIEEMMHTLSSRIQQAITCTFSQFSKPRADMGNGKEKKQHVVVSFLALLELIKQNMILAQQDTMFDEIDIKSVDMQTPTYR